jgi:hypothetical protein
MIAYGDFSRPAGEHALYRLIDHRPGLERMIQECWPGTRT